MGSEVIQQSMRASPPGTPPRFRISRSTVGPLRAGHPWVFRDGLVDAPVGEVVELTSEEGAVVAWGVGDEGPIAVRVLGRGTAPKRPLSEVIAERIRAADVVRNRLVPTQTDAYRLVCGAGDGLPGLVVDRYGDLAVLRLYSAAWQSWLAAIVRALGSLGWVSQVYRRFGVHRVDGREGGEALLGGEPSETKVISEYGMKMLVRPRVGQKTGLFLDQREHRELIRRWGSGRRVANLFAYTGGFSVSAALGGAARVATVDIAPDAIEDAKENFRLNDLDPDLHVFEVADAFAWKPKGSVDLLIVDPPALTRTKKSDGAARSSYRKLHKRLGPFVARGGLLASSSCSARLSNEAWQQALREGLSSTGDWSWHWSSQEPPDHPTALAHSEGRYLKFAVLGKR
jgi:23S rRNA (cytosine1962-C5)-methyltransferase